MKKQMVSCALFILGLTGCGTTRIVSSNADAGIYINNLYKGNGEVSIPRTGTPQKIHIVAKYQGQEVGAIDEHRKVKFITCVAGYFTYGLGFLFTWKYPETIIIPMQVVSESENNKFDNPESIWNLPPGEWNKKSKW